MVDTLVLGTSGESRVGSSPTLGTNGSKMRRLISVERRDAKVHTKDR